MKKNAPIIPLVIAFVLLVLAIGGYAMWYRTVEGVHAQAEDLALQVQMQNDNVARIVAARAALDSLTGEESTIQQYFVDPNNIVTFLESLQAMGHALGAQVEVVSVSKDTVVPHGHLTISLKVTGSFDAVMRTLGAVEYGPYDGSLTSTSLDATPVAPGSKATNWTATAIFSVGTQAAHATTTPATP